MIELLGAAKILLNVFLLLRLLLLVRLALQLLFEHHDRLLRLCQLVPALLMLLHQIDVLPLQVIAGMEQDVLIQYDLFIQLLLLLLHFFEIEFAHVDVRLRCILSIAHRGDRRLHHVAYRGAHFLLLGSR